MAKKKTRGPSTPVTKPIKLTRPVKAPIEDEGASEEGDEAAPGRRRVPRYPYDEFVRHWVQASSIDDMAERTGLSRSSVQAIATRLRHGGLALAKMATIRAQPIDVDALSAIMEEATSE